MKTNLLLFLDLRYKVMKLYSCILQKRIHFLSMLFQHATMHPLSVRRMWPVGKFSITSRRTAKLERANAKWKTGQFFIIFLELSISSFTTIMIKHRQFMQLKTHIENNKSKLIGKSPKYRQLKS